MAGISVKGEKGIRGAVGQKKRKDFDVADRQTGDRRGCVISKIAEKFSIPPIRGRTKQPQSPDCQQNSQYKGEQAKKLIFECQKQKLERKRTDDSQEQRHRGG